MLVRLTICPPCTAKLREILRERGEAAMGEVLGATLCDACLQRVPGWSPGAHLVTKMRRTPPKPSGVA